MGDPEVLVGRYRLVRQLGAGAMGTVWLARDETLDRDVAVKQVRYSSHIDEAQAGGPADLKPEEVARQRALREGRLAARLSHPNAASIYDVAVHEGDPWLVMEYVPSRTLTEVVRDHGPIPPERAALLGVQIGGALAEAHRVGIVHRDVKPSNILLTETGEAKITDFGIARGSGDVTLTRTGLLAGTPAYFAPELARGSDPSPRSDVWSLGASLYYAVEGRPPFGTDDNPLVLLGRVANQEVPIPERAGPLTSTLMRLLSKDPVRRPSMERARSMLADVFERTAMVPVPSFEDAAEDDEVQAGSDDDAREEPDPAREAGAAVLGPVDPVGSGTVGVGPVAEDAAEGAADLTEKYDPLTPPDSTGPGGSAGSGLRPRRRNLWVAAAAVLLVLAAGGGWALVTAQGDGDRNAGANPEPSKSREQKAGPKPSNSAEPTPPKRSPVGKPTKTQKKKKPAVMSKSAMQGFISTYYTLLPQQRDAAWQMLTPRMQQRSGGRGTFERWWASVSDVRATNIRADPEHERVTATVRILRKGRWHPESWRFDLVKSPDGSRLLMERGRTA